MSLPVFYLLSSFFLLFLKYWESLKKHLVIPREREKPCLTATSVMRSPVITTIYVLVKKPLLILYESTWGKTKLTWNQIWPVKDTQNCNVPRMPHQNCTLWNSFHSSRPIFIVNSVKPIYLISLVVSLSKGLFLWATLAPQVNT